MECVPAQDTADVKGGPVFSIRSTKEWRQWLYRFARHQRTTASQLIDGLLAKLAAQEGFDPPPDRTQQQCSAGSKTAGSRGDPAGMLVWPEIYWEGLGVKRKPMVTREPADWEAIIRRVQTMNNQEFLETLRKAGIIDQDGKLTPPYRARAEENQMK